MCKENLFPITLAFALIALIQTAGDSNNLDKPQTIVATVNYGKVLFEETQLAAYQQDDDGTMVPATSTSLTEEETDRLTKAFARMETVINEIAKEYGFSLIIRQDSRPSHMRFPIGSAEWKPDQTQTPVWRQGSDLIEKQKRLAVKLDSRIAYEKQVNITKLVIQRMRDLQTSEPTKQD